MGDAIDTAMSRRHPDYIEKETANIYRFQPDVNTNGENDTCLNNKDHKKTRQKTWPPKFQLHHLFFSVLGLVLFIMDLISDCRLAVLYFTSDQKVEFYLTLGFILGPSFFSGLISTIWYTTDHVVLTEQQTPREPGTGEQHHDSEDVVPLKSNSRASNRNDQSPRYSQNGDEIRPVSSQTSDSDHKEHENGHIDVNTDSVSTEHDNEKNGNTHKELLDDTLECGNHGNDTIDHGDHGNDNKTRTIKNKKKFCLRITMSCLQLGRIFRSIEYIGYILKSWRCHSSRQEHICLKAIDQKQDAAILGLVDGFLESALQLVLQLYLSVAFSLPMDFYRVLTMLLSLGSTALTHTVYYRTNRKSKRWKRNVSYRASFIYLLWRICELGPRFLLLALSVYCLFPWIFVAIVLHIFIIFLSFCIQNPKLLGLCPNRVLKTLFFLLLSYVALFCNINVEEGKTRVRTLLYYILFYAENIAMATLIISIYHHQFGLINYKWAYSSLSLVPGLVLHMVFQTLYYKRCHPSIGS